MPKFRTQYDPYDKRVRPGLKCLDPSRTDQSQAQDADINVMLERFRVTGQIKQAAAVPTYGDYTGVNDFFTARGAILHAEDEFMRLPPKLREQLGHDPQNFLAYVQDPANLKSLEERGYVKANPGGIGGVAPDANSSPPVASTTSAAPSPSSS